MIPVPVLFVTYNRLEYSKRALESVLNDPGIPVDVMIYDNGSTDGTAEWLGALKIAKDASGIHSIVRGTRNVGLAPVMNDFFNRNRSFPFVAKVDNDTVLPDYWLSNLMAVMMDPYRHPKLGAVSATCLRPNGDTFAEWVRKYMVSKNFGAFQLHFNSYVLGTGVLINMDMIRTRGLLFEKFPRSPESGPDDPCLISGWTAYIREAHEYDGWSFAFYSKVHANLLNLSAEHVLSNDYPEYDAEVQAVRDQGNAWWESIGGLDGARKYVQEHGGLAPLHYEPKVLIPDSAYQEIRDRYFHTEPSATCGAKVLTEASDLPERATAQFWERRIAEHGTTGSTFLSTPQRRINEFTERHMEVLDQHVIGKDVLDVACGWGRVSWAIAQNAKSYIGVDFMPALIEKARESLPRLQFQVADARHLPFPDASFDCVVSVTGLSSFAAVFDEVLAEFHRVLRPGGRILFLEERFARIDWKLESE